jgi:hypothetical protein
MPASVFCPRAVRTRLFLAAALAALAACPSYSRADIVYAWGQNTNGQIGDNSSTNRPTPLAVPGLATGVSIIAAGGNHSLALQNGTLLAWGLNNYGEVGDGSTTWRYVPVPVVGMNSNISTVTSGSAFSLAIQNGAVYAWGINSFGQIGDASTTNRLTPVLVHNMSSGVTKLAAGGAHTLAIKSGVLYAWGYNNYGEIGNTGVSGATVSTPVTVTGMGSGVTDIAGGVFHSLAIKNGGVYAWGWNVFGQLGNSTNLLTNNPNSTPTLIPSLSSNVTAIAGGYYHSLAIQNGSVYAWGGNNLGQLGLGFTDSSPHTTPTLIPGLSNVTQLLASNYSSYALTASGALYSWGDNTYGQLGLGDTIARSSPTLVAAPSGYKYSSISVNAGGFHVLATLAQLPAAIIATKVANTVTVQNTSPLNSDSATLSALSIQQAPVTNGTFVQSGLSNGIILAGAQQTGAISLNKTGNELNNAKAAATLSFSMAGTTITASSGEGNYSYPLAGTITGNAIPTNISTTFSTPLAANVAAGDTLATLNAPEGNGNGSIGNTTVTFLASSPLAANATASIAIRARTAAEKLPAATPPLPAANSQLVSDVAMVTVTSSPATYVVQFNYDETVLPGDETTLAHSNCLYLARLGAGADTLPGNTDDAYYNPATVATPFYGPYAGQGLGNWGIDTTNNTAWVVLPGNAQGQFAVLALPEPASLALLTLAAAPLLFRRQRRIP